MKSNNTRIGLVLAVCLLGCYSSYSWAERYALLVGVDRVVNVSSVPRLEGVWQDVKYIESFSSDYWGVKKENLRVFANDYADAKVPNYDVVKNAMHNIAQNVVAGDEILLYLSGHGFKQPSLNSIGELDGLDEVFALSDTTLWNPVKKSVGNALIDDEIYDWMSKIISNGGYVWLIVDSCFAGGMTRAASKDDIGRGYKVTADKWALPEWFGINMSMVNQVETKIETGKPAAGKGKASILSHVTQNDGLETSRILAFYAVKETEQAKEVEYDGKKVSLFTHQIFKSLELVKEINKLTLATGMSGITYTDVANSLVRAYNPMPSWVPKPVIAGDWRRDLIAERNSSLGSLKNE